MKLDESHTMLVTNYEIYSIRRRLMFRCFIVKESYQKDQHQWRFSLFVNSSQLQAC